MSLKIIGTGHCVPKKIVSNDELATFLDTSDEWITSRTGIKNRHVCTDETLSDLAISAAKNAIEKSGLSASDIDLIICSTIQGDYITPSLACIIQVEIGATCPAFDINGACSGFIYALNVADSFISSNKANNILIVGAEMMSKVADWSDRSSCVLFGDGAGACVVSNGNALKYIHLTASGNIKPLYLHSINGNSPFGNSDKQENYLYMDGQEVFKFAVSVVEKETMLALEALNINPDDIDFYLLHQANKRIIDSIRTRLKQPEEKFPVNIDKYGNTSSASILILLDEVVSEGKIKKGDTLLMTAFGAGLTTGICVINWE